MAYKLWIIWKPLPNGSLQGFKNDKIRASLYGAMMIRATIPPKPRVPIIPKNDSLILEIKSINIRLITITIPVPKSGSNIIRPKKRKIIKRIGRVPFLKNLMVFSLFDKYFAVKIIKDIFASWQPLKSSYTSASDSLNEGGRPMMDETEISKTTDTQRNNDSNSTDNRI